MKLENQVCSLDLAKKLKELKVKQESLWFWNPGMTNNKVWWEIRRKPYNYGSPTKPKKAVAISAFTVAELYQIHWDMNKGFPSVIGLRPIDIADYLAKEIILEKGLK